MLMSDMSDSWLTKNEFDKFILRHNITTLGLLYDSVIDMHVIYNSCNLFDWVRYYVFYCCCATIIMVNKDLHILLQQKYNRPTAVNYAFIFIISPNVFPISACI